MKVSVYNNIKSETGKVELPAQFNEKVRPDLIKKAVMVINANTRQPYGAKFRAGLRAQGKLSRRRKDYKASYGIGISRVPRKIMSRRGTRMNWVGAVAPGTIKGRRAHPPKAEKVFDRKINKKEKRMAIRSAISATVQRGIVEERGHKIPKEYPFIIDSAFEDISKTKEFVNALVKLGFAEELERISERKVRHGKGKMRGRKYKTKKGPLVVVSKQCSLLSAGRNITGVDVILVNKLNARALAPGMTVGRATLFTKAAVDRIEKEQLFTNAEKPNKESEKAKPKKEEKKPEVKAKR